METDLSIIARLFPTQGADSNSQAAAILKAVSGGVASFSIGGGAITTSIPVYVTVQSTATSGGWQTSSNSKRFTINAGEKFVLYDSTNGHCAPLSETVRVRVSGDGEPFSLTPENERTFTLSWSATTIWCSTANTPVYLDGNDKVLLCYISSGSGNIVQLANQAATAVPSYSRKTLYNPSGTKSSSFDEGSSIVMMRCVALYSDASTQKMNRLGILAPGILIV